MNKSKCLLALIHCLAFCLHSQVGVQKKNLLCDISRYLFGDTFIDLQGQHGDIYDLFMAVIQCLTFPFFSYTEKYFIVEIRQWWLLPLRTNFS